jgi:pimeloyl-ACP methyl ester carboxylesterase
MREAVTMNQSLATVPTSHRYTVNGIEMHVVTAGSGPDVLLLHGFPDSHELWRHQIPALVAAGFRVIAPDLRGFGLTEIPKGGVAAYRVENLVADVVALLDVLGVEKVRLVAHDWGAVIGWLTAIKHPDRIDRYVAISVGHPTAYAREAASNRN